MSKFLEVLRSIEKKWQERWEKERIFESDPKENKKKYFVTVPYPYTSGALHIGHARAFATGDIIARWKRLEGYNVLFPGGFHITGTPIEAISYGISVGDENIISLHKEYISYYISDKKEIEKILESFKDPWNVALFYAKNAKNDLTKLGCSIDWRRKFTTGDEEYQKFITWQYYKLKEKGCLVQGSYPVLYCLNHENAVGEDDIKGGDEIKASVIEFYLIKFKLDENKFIVAATLRPETIFGVTNIWVNPNAEYVEMELKDSNEIWIVSKDSVIKFEKQGKEIEVRREFKGEELIGTYVETPIGKKVPVLPANFVDPDTATGVVYCVPAHAPYDYMALIDLKKNKEFQEKYGINIENIEPIQVIKLEGYSSCPAKDVCEKLEIKSQEDKEALDKATEILYKEEYYNGIIVNTIDEFNGKLVKETKEEIFKWLYSKGFADKMYEVSALKKPVKCRCGGKIIVAVLKNQWFIDYSKPEWKKLAKDCLNNMVIIPEIYRNYFEDILEWLDKRPCARKRGIGTRLPFDPEWIIESLSDSTIYMAFYTVIHKIRENNIKPEQLTEEFWDYIFLGKGSSEEVSKKTGISKELIEDMRKEFLYWYPVDCRATAVMHISNHLSFFIFHHAIIFPKQHWPKMLVLFEPVICEGRKMSKSLGNTVSLIKAIENYSAEVFRLYAVSSADFSSYLDWRQKDVETLVKHIEDFFNLCEDIVSSNVNKFNIDEYENLTEISKWILNEWKVTEEKVINYYKEVKLREVAIELFFKFRDKIHTYRKIMFTMDKKEEYYKVSKFILEKWLHLLNPIVPHITEEFWEKLGNKEFLSIKVYQEANNEIRNENYDNIYEIINNLIDDIKQVIQLSKIENPSKIKIVLPSEWKYRAVEKIENPFRKLPEIIESCKQDDTLKNYIKEIPNIVKKLQKQQIHKIDKSIEEKLYNEILNYIKSVIQVEIIEVVKEDSINHPKAKQALPSKPAIIVE